MLYPISEVRNSVTNLDHPECVAVGRNGKLYAGGEGRPEVFAEGLARIPDGLAFDAEGNLYVTTYASNCIYGGSSDHHMHLLCQAGETLLLCQPASGAFGGSNFDRLFVSNLGRDHISVLALKIQGQGLWCHRAQD